MRRTRRIEPADGPSALVPLAAVFSLLLGASPSPASDVGTKYLDAVTEFLDTLIEDGTDRYGPEDSPMFCSILGLQSHRLPDEAPPLLEGQRNADRAYPGGNLEHDMLTLLTMDHVSEIQGEPRYREAANRYLRYFLETCAPAGNGLFPCGEHAFWNFRKEAIARPTHENLGLLPRPFLDRLWAVDPDAVARYIRTLTEHIVDKEAWYWNRHASIVDDRDHDIRAFPRHGGFYLYQWAYLYMKRPSPDLLRWVGRTVDVHWRERHPVTGDISSYVLADPRYEDRGFHNYPLGTMSLGLSILEANDLLRRRDAAKARLRTIGTAYTIRALREPLLRRRAEKFDIDLPPKDAPAPEYPGQSQYWAHGGGAHERHWNASYAGSGGFGFSGRAKLAQLSVTAHQRTGLRAPLRFAKRVWKKYRGQEPPTDARLWPGKGAGVIALSLALHDATGEVKYLTYARRVADLCLEKLFAHGLFRAAAGKGYYEAANGAGSLAYELLRLHLRLTGSDHRLPRNDWDR